MTSVSSEDHLSSLDLDEEPLTELTDEEIYNLVEDTTRANEVLHIETTMFESFLKRVEPKDSTLQQNTSALPATHEVSVKGLRVSLRKVSRAFSCWYH